MGTARRSRAAPGVARLLLVTFGFQSTSLAYALPGREPAPVGPAPTAPVPLLASLAPPSGASCPRALEERRAPVLSVARERLWPPNHALIDVGLEVDLTPACRGRAALALEAWSDEPDEDQSGDGSFPGDARFQAGELLLRSERKGDGDGRVYLIVARAVDPEGTSGVACRAVVVPQSGSPASLANVHAQAALATSTCTSGAPPAGYVLLATQDEAPPNRAPVVDAGEDQAVEFGTTVLLDGSVVDDGRPTGAVQVAWTVVSAPGPVTFGTPTATDTTASFATAGSHVLRLTATDGVLSAWDEVTIEVGHAMNQPPQVNAGADQVLTLPTVVASLTGQATDDGRPAGTLTLAWSVVDAPGPVAFADASAAITTATLGGAGTYVLRLSASDGQLGASDDVTIVLEIEPAPSVSIADAGVAEGSDARRSGELVVSLSHAAPQAVSVDYMTVGGSAAAGCDYRLRYGTLTFGPGETEKTVAVPVLGDLQAEPSETVVVRIANETGVVVARAEGTLTIQDDDAANATPSPHQHRSPADGATGVPAAPTLSWSTGDPEGEPLRHDVYLGSSFALDGQEWVAVCPASAGPLTAAVHAYDEAGDRLFVIEADAPAVVWSLENASALGGAPRWTAVEATGGPGSVEDATAVPVSAGEALVLAGSQAWLLSGLGTPAPTWSLLPSGPPARSGAAAAALPDGAGALVFGGVDPGGARLNDLWLIERSRDAWTWRTVLPAGAPPAPRDGAALAIDAATGGAYLFGGRLSDDAAADDLWILRAAWSAAPAWEELPLDPRPPARFGHALAFDPGARRLVLFGGASGGPARYAFADVWVSGTDVPWTRVAATRPPPAGRYAMASAYSAGSGRLIVGPGQNDFVAAPPADLWVLTNAAGTLPALALDHPDSSLAADGLTPGAEHAWRVISRDPAGAARSSPVWRFTSNQRPLVDAGPDRSVILPPGEIALEGTVADDGLPGPLSVSWTLVEGPGPVTFADAAAPVTAATVSVRGTYVLRLAADDGMFAVSDTVTVVVTPLNVAPAVNAGPDVQGQRLASVPLAGSATDDGLPDGSMLQVLWAVVSGPGTVTFASAASASTSAVFHAAGTYVLSLTASDGTLSTTDTVTATIAAAALPDLVPTTLDVAGVAVDPSLSVTGVVRVHVANHGPGPSDPSTVAVFEDRDGDERPGAADAVLGSAAVPALAAAASIAVEVAVSGTVRFAGNILHAMVDPAGALAEANEANNHRSTAPACAPHAFSGWGTRVKWTWVPTVEPFHKQVMMQPLAGDLDGDGSVEVVFSSWASIYDKDGIVRAVRGSDGTEIFALTDPAYRVDADANMAIGDLEGDGRLEIFAVHEGLQRVLALNADGTVRWLSAPITNRSLRWGEPTLADLDGNGVSEVLVGDTVWNADGTLRWAGDWGSVRSVVADLTGDGKPEVIGGAIYDRFGQILSTAIRGGASAVANLDDDPAPEIVNVLAGVNVYEHTGALKWTTNGRYFTQFSGLPVVVDVDGDGTREIGVSAGNAFWLLDAAGNRRWTSPYFDGHGRLTASAFDFEGDGKPEFVYTDELNFRIVRGTDGAVLVDLPIGSATAIDGATVADVDADGHAEVIVPSSSLGNAPAFGLRAIEGAQDDWASARRLWNQLSYHITNLRDDGSVPPVESPSWLAHNSYRVQGRGPEECPFGRPDLIPASAVVSPDGTTVTVRTANVGNGIAPRGLPVSLYDGDPAIGGAWLSSAMTATHLVPGGFEDVVIATGVTATSGPVWVSVDDAGGLRGRVLETDEGNNLRDTGRGLGGPGLADIAASHAQGQIATDPTTLESAGEVTVRLANTGAAETGGFAISAFADLDGDGFAEPGEPVLGTSAHAGLAAAAGETVALAVAGTVPFLDAPLTVAADTDAIVVEADEGNNAARTSESCEAPPPASLAARLKWQWTTTTILPDAMHVGTPPVVADLDRDGAPEVYAVTFALTGNGYLRSFDGATGAERFALTDAARQLWRQTTLAIGDLDGNGSAEIVAIASDFKLTAFRPDGSILWKSTESSFSDAVTLADLDGDGRAEVLSGLKVLDHAGRLLWTAPNSIGGQANFQSHATIAADLDGDGRAEVLNCATARNADGSLRWDVPTIASRPNCSVAVGELDDDPQPEVILNHGVNRMYVLEHDGSIKWAVFNAIGRTIPALADVDGDGRTDIAYGQNELFGWLDHLGVVHGTSARFSFEGVGAVVFDLDGDGVAEGILQDRTGLRIARGREQAIVTAMPEAGTCSSLTYPTPVVADVDGDTRAEIVAGVYRCFGDAAPRGLFVYESAEGGWAAARPIWNQYAFHSTAIGDDLRVRPLQAAAPTGFLGNGHGRGRRLRAGDLSVSFPRRAIVGSDVQLRVRVGNGGVAPAESDVPVGFFDGDPAQGRFLREVRTPSRLGPGGFVDLSVAIPGDTPSDASVFVAIDPQPAAPRPDCRPGNDVFDTGFKLNQAPVVDAGPAVTASLPTASAELSGSVTDDDLPVGGAVVAAWSVAAGPGTVTFASPASAATAATFSAAGAYTLRLTATDGAGRTAFDDLAVTVFPPNQAPVVSAGPDVSIERPPTSSLTLAGQATDDGLPVPSALLASWSVVAGPAAVVFSNAAALTTTATFSAPGVYQLRLTVNDSDLASSDDVIVTVVAGNQAPQVSAGADQVLILPSATASLAGTVTDDGLPAGSALGVTWTLVSGPGSAVIAAPQAAATTAMLVEPGVYTFRLTAADGALSASDDVAVRLDAADAQGGPPVAEIDAPGPGAAITEPVAVVGTANAGALFRWTLEARAAGESAWATLAAGTSAVEAGVLGAFDPTLRMNGIHELRLSVMDTAARVARKVVPVLLRDNLKVGHFTVSFVDLEVPVSGLPIRLTRTYDSRDKRRGDFGHGWRLDVSDVRVDEAGTLGDAWTGQVTWGAFPSYCVVASSAKLVTVTMPGGQVMEFEAVAAPQCQTFVPPSEVQLAFQARPGTYGTLTPVGGGTATVVGSWPSQGGSAPMYLFGTSDFQLFDPGVYRLTLPDGRSMVIDQREGLRSMSDLNANTLTVSAGGILHSSGRGIAFDRDAQGRIERVTDPDGHEIVYAYSPEGDLASVTDRTQNTTSFTYLPAVPHHLETIRDPLGRTPIRNEYDPDGRLKSHTDAFGKTITYTHDLSARQEVVTDRTGAVRVLEYDARGNVTKETQPDGKVIRRTFDARNNRTSETLPHDPLTTPDPPKTTYVFDPQDNLTSTTDPEDNTTEYTYNARRQVVTVKDARQKTTTNVHDPATGHLLSTQDAAGGMTSYTYDPRGNVKTQTSTLDGQPVTTTYEYDTAGNLTQETDALGHPTTYTYDLRGNRRTQTTTRTLYACTGTDCGPTGTETLTTTYEYDNAGRLTKTIDPDGSFTRTVYDELGRQKETYDKLARKTTYEYDEMGRLTKSTFPDLTFEQSTYDAEGRRLTSRDRGGRTTTYEYDPLGRLKKTIFPDTTFPDTTFTENTYDAAGRLTATKDARGKTTTYDYDDAGRRTRVRDPLGNETVFTYDPNGNQRTVRDARLNTTTFEYDDVNRRTKTIFPDTTFTQTGYDALGRRTSETDQAGKTTRFEYDKLGRLIKVIDAALKETVYAYDELGARILQRDANGHETRFEYDKLGRETKRILPDGKYETKTYDPAGNVETRIDFMGRTTQYEYDTNNRLILRSYPGSSQPSVGLTYTLTGRRETATDSRGTTTYGYDNRDRLTSLLYPDGRQLEYAYDGNGNRTTLTARIGTNVLTTTYTYDDASRLDVVTDPLGRTYDHGYDANGNRESLTQPNGTVTVYQHDALNRLSNLSTMGPLGTVFSQAFTLGTAGNRTRIVENDGTTKDYGYDDLYRLTQDKVTDTLGLLYEKEFTYDAVGNRLTQVTTGLGAASIGYAYDTRDRLLTENAQSLTYDDNGNLTAKVGEATYAWDHENRLVQVTKADGTVVQHLYDSEGNRVQTTTTPPGGPTTVTNLLVDTSGSLSHVVAETDGPGPLGALYVRGDDLLAVLRPNGSGGWNSRFIHADGIGSIRRLTDEGGLIADGYTYSAFGELLAHTGADPQPYAFTGEPLDTTSGFQYHRARWLDPRTGRFARMDPFPGRLFDPSSLHRYLYAAVDPIGKIDPTGEEVGLPQLLTVGAIIGILTANTLYRPVGITETVKVSIGGALAGTAAAAVLAYLAGAGSLSLATGALGSAGAAGAGAARVAIIDGRIVEYALARAPNADRLFLGEFYGSRFFFDGRWQQLPASAPLNAGMLWIENMIARFGGHHLGAFPRTIEAMRPGIDAARQIVFNISHLSAGSLALQEFNYIMSRPDLVQKTTFVTSVVAH